MNKRIVYQVPATGTRSSRIAYQQSLIGRHVASHWAAGDGSGAAAQQASKIKMVNVQATSNLAIGFPLFLELEA